VKGKFTIAQLAVGRFSYGELFEDDESADVRQSDERVT